MNMKSFKPQNLILGLSLLFTFTFLGYGQQNQRDTSKSLVGFIKKGKLSFHSRTYLMSTLNEGKGNDFFTLANGNIFSYKTPIFHGFQIDRKSTRLNSSHVRISYAVFCLKKKK